MSRIPFMTLDPPYRLASDQLSFRFFGWTEVDDPAAPDVRLALNGLEVPVSVRPRPDVAAHFPDLRQMGFLAAVDFVETLRPLAATDFGYPFLLEATLTSDDRRRTFEYAVTDEWLLAVFGRPLKARPIPPEHLQVRVAGAAAGGYHRTGVEVVRRIAGLLRDNAAPLGRQAAILDFGCGPGRVIDALHDVVPGALLYGTDIDPEAIGWAKQHLGDVGVFRVNDSEPPLPFASESFDLIVCISVFTHLPRDMQWMWLSELRRCLRPGGYLLTTKMDPDNPQLPDAVRAEGVAQGYVYWGDSAATDGLPGFYRLAYHSADYVRREWGRYFEVLHVGLRDLNTAQDAILLRRPRQPFACLPRPLRRTLHPAKPWLAPTG